VRAQNSTSAGQIVDGVWYIKVYWQVSGLAGSWLATPSRPVCFFPVHRYVLYAEASASVIMTGDATRRGTGYWPLKWPQNDSTKLTCDDSNRHCVFVRSLAIMETYSWPNNHCLVTSIKLVCSNTDCNVIYYRQCQQPDNNGSRGVLHVGYSNNNYTVSQKMCHYTIVHNFDRCWPIFKTFHCCILQNNCYKTHATSAHHILDVSLHHLATCKRTKLAKFCCI